MCCVLVGFRKEHTHTQPIFSVFFLPLVVAFIILASVAGKSLVDLKIRSLIFFFFLSFFFLFQGLPVCVCVCVFSFSSSHEQQEKGWMYFFAVPTRRKLSKDEKCEGGGEIKTKNVCCLKRNFSRVSEHLVRPKNQPSVVAAWFRAQHLTASSLPKKKRWFFGTESSPKKKKLWQTTPRLL